MTKFNKMKRELMNCCHSCIDLRRGYDEVYDAALYEGLGPHTVLL